jgi:hypothetical protein
VTPFPLNSLSPTLQQLDHKYNNGNSDEYKDRNGDNEGWEQQREGKKKGLEMQTGIGIEPLVCFFCFFILY